MVELVDALDSKSSGGNSVRVRFSPPALTLRALPFLFSMIVPGKRIRPGFPVDFSEFQIFTLSTLFSLLHFPVASQQPIDDFIMVSAFDEVNLPADSLFLESESLENFLTGLEG